MQIVSYKHRQENSDENFDLNIALENSEALCDWGVIVILSMYTLMLKRQLRRCNETVRV